VKPDSYESAQHANMELNTNVNTESTTLIYGTQSFMLVQDQQSSAAYIQLNVKYKNRYIKDRIVVGSTTM
jgi:hypothetical protein